jgi:hypothetical protein
MGEVEQVVDFNPESPCDLLQSQKAGIGFNSKFVKLKKFGANFASLRRLLLRPTALEPQFPKPLSKSL